jgi:hypothetical protein
MKIAIILVLSLFFSTIVHADQIETEHSSQTEKRDIPEPPTIPQSEMTHRPFNDVTPYKPLNHENHQSFTQWKYLILFEKFTSDFSKTMGR